MASKAAVDFSKVLASGLSKQTSAELVSFRKRSDEAKRVVTQLKQLSTSVDFAHYKNVLKVSWEITRAFANSKNQDVVADAEKLLNNFKPKTYDVAAQTKALHSFETTAIQQAEEAAAKIETELKDLKETLSNIENARPFDQLTATDVINARPEIAKAIEEMVKKGKWSLPGYEEKFGSLALA
ncbi:ATP synthase d subunit [Malassezia psittaci]|uniref:ATP synthase subunit d, mitochondrial n=1 Tax=Malassezia psittaci TaxID=1821823 RepID=A0AAF0FAQ6_9BASI|nr:ATP synthase d subunit [Malassezia psittaci]